MEMIRFAPHLAIFVEVARARSFSAVARARGVAASSVVRPVDQLETELGVRLFTRTTRSVRLTDAGDVLLRRATDILRQLADARAEVAAFEAGARGVLRVRCPPSFAHYYVVPLVAELAVEHPDLQIELDLSERRYDSATEQLDACIQLTDPGDSLQVAVRLATHRWVLCASPSYIAASGPVTGGADLARHRRIEGRIEADGHGWARLLPPGAAGPGSVFRCDDFDAQRVAALFGVGLAFLPTWVVGQDIKAGRMLHLMDDPDGRQQGIYILRTVLAAPTKLRLFTERLRRHIGAPAAWEYARRPQDAAPLRRAAWADWHG